MTIVSGIPQTGKSHLAVNLAFEYIRRGRLVGLYHELAAESPIENIVSLKAPDLKQRRDGDDQKALDFARQALAKQPDFIPAAVLAAELQIFGVDFQTLAILVKREFIAVHTSEGAASFTDRFFLY